MPKYHYMLVLNAVLSICAISSATAQTPTSDSLWDSIAARGGIGIGGRSDYNHIEWNCPTLPCGRRLLSKYLPVFPSGHLNTKIVLHFGVAPDGIVAWVRVMPENLDEAVKEAAISAVHRWRFTKITSDYMMEGKMIMQVVYSK